MAIITISRGSFAGGKAVAQRLSKQLGYDLLGREELLAQAAQEYGVSEREMAGALNESPPFWQQVPGKRMTYVKCVTAVLVDHVRQGNLVYHGHVGHLLLGGLSHVLAVRVIADMETRIRSAMEQARLERDAAVAHIHRVDKERSRWARLLYGVDWQDPEQYDVVLNLGRMSAESACRTIARMTELADYMLTAESRKELEDLSLSSRVWAAMAKNPVTRSAGIQVVADGGQVVITGSVGSPQAVEAIPRLASAVEGIKNLRCEVGVGLDWGW
jgi:cytidylate kinase